MNLGIKLRLVGLSAAIVLLGLTMVFMAAQSQRQAAQLRVQLARVDSESFRIADQFREQLRHLNDLLYAYGRSHMLPKTDEFFKASHALDLWIDEQKPKLATETERSIMGQIDASYDDYLKIAKELLARLEAIGEASATIDDYTGLREESQRLSDLGQDLTRAHLESRNQALSQVGGGISQLRLLMLVSLGGLLLFGIALSVIVYRDMILPLRLKLVESQTLVERQEKLASLGMLAAGVAHEIRNPLTAIKAALFIQQKKFQPGTQEFDDVKIVEREILRLENVVNEFLLFARPVEPQLMTIAADAPLQEVHALLAPKLRENNIEFILEKSPSLRVLVDAAQIKQVLINLIQNAADAIGQNGTIRLRARPDRKRIGNRDTNVVILEVEDTGKGIPPAVQERLFDPFFTTKEAGTGLGLSIAAGIVQKHGGLLQYQTQMNQGTTFGIILPQAKE
jgi:signal transduction histidine kinase